MKFNPLHGKIIFKERLFFQIPGLFVGCDS